MKKLLLLSFLLMGLAGKAQEKDSPKVGLVLSGGGAKGLAHIGVLKVIEEAGVKVDYIAGTSMGAIVGSLYAAGYTPQQLDSIFDRTDFDRVIRDQLPRRTQTFHERKVDERYALTLPFDGFNISFPSGLSSGQNLYNLMSRLTHHLEGESEFRDLPIPFFCVAANIETGKQRIFDSGSLPQAVAASAAIPTIFSPVLVDGDLYTDGGIFNNYPVEELKARGMDYIIGVDVQDTLRSREDLNSMVGVLTQISNFSTIHGMRGKREKTDVYIAPPIGPYNAMSFGAGREIIDLGEETALEKMEELRELAVLQGERSLERRKVPAADSLNIVDVRIEGDNTYPEEYILGKLHLKYPDRISYEDLNFGIHNLSATGNFSKINYQLEPLQNSFVLVMELEEDPHKTFLRLGIHYDNLYKSGGLMNITRKSLLLSNDVASLDVVVGDNFRYEFEYLWDKGFYWSLGLKSRFHEFGKDVGIAFAEEYLGLGPVDVNSISLDYSDITNQVYMQTLFEKKFAVRLGAEHKYLKLSTETLASGQGTEIAPRVFDKSNYFSVFGALKLDTYDNRYFPSRGFFMEGDFHLYLFSSDYHNNFTEFSIAKAKLGHAFPLFPGFTALISGEGGLRIGENDNSAFDFFLGGYGNDFINNIVPFYGYDFLDISADSFVKGMLELDYEIMEKNHLVLGANAAFVQDDLFSDLRSFPDLDFTGYSLGYGLETFFGPVEVKYSYSPELKDSQWYFSLGFWF